MKTTFFNNFHKLFSKTLFLLFLFNNYLNAQNIVDNKAWVKVENNNFKSSTIGNSFTNDTEFNTFLESINVITYKQALPFAKNSELKKFYEIECDCDLSVFDNYITENHPYSFSSFQKDLEFDTMMVHDVSDYMYWLQKNDTTYDHMWYLDIIEAPNAWNITTGDTSVKIAILDSKIDITHPDLASEILLPYDPYTLQPFGCVSGTSNWDNHGSGVAGIASGETSPQGTPALGQMPSIGYNTKMYFYYSAVGYLGFLQRCLHSSNVMGVKALVTAASHGINCGMSPSLNQTAKIILKEVLDNGTSIIAPAGNNSNGYPCGNDAFYPLHPSFDDRIIVVSSTGKDDKHFNTASGASGTHSFFPGVDLCAPGYGVTVALSTRCDTAPPFPYFGYASGTSFASPLVAGIVSLMYSVNSGLSTADVQAILKSTVDPIIDADSFPGMVGTGRVNAFKAVQKALSAKSTSVDLYIRDRYDDYGLSGGYHWQATRDNSPDIWVRRQNDGLSNRNHQDPEYSVNNPNYVYVQVRNKSTDTSSSQEKLKLYWTKAASWSSWPQNWDGSQPLVGNLIDSIIVPPLAPGKDTILEFTWNVLNPYIHSNWSTCLLARLEDNPLDPITVYPGRIDDDVFFNNNIAMKNITVIDSIFGNSPPQMPHALYPVGRYVFVGNPSEGSATFNLKISENVENSSIASITEEAELKLMMDNEGWDLLINKVNETDGIEIFSEEEKSFIITQNEIEIKNIEFEGLQRIPIYIGFNFLTDEVSDETYYTFKFGQWESSTDKLLGAQRFEITRKVESSFAANAGPDVFAKYGTEIELSATVVNEPAQYHWFDENGVIVGEESTIFFYPEENQTYTLEVTSEEDGFKDYDKVNVTVQYNWIDYVSPNPANNQFTVDYHFENGNTG